jgi:hypothetical protein
VRRLGENAGVISVDEKAKVPLELPALSKSTRMVMDRTQRIITADHTFSIGKKQSLAPTVICGVNYDPKVCVVGCLYVVNILSGCRKDWPSVYHHTQF